jgi:hypothetical protein
MKKPWKTKAHCYICRFAFIGRDDGRFIGDEVPQTSISAQLYFYNTHYKDDILTHVNIKRKLIDDWKDLCGWRYPREDM